MPIYFQPEEWVQITYFMPTYRKIMDLEVTVHSLQEKIADDWIQTAVH